jgi:predicted peptidase
MTKMALFAFAVIFGIQGAGLRNDVDGFVARAYRSGAKTMPYRLFTPRGYDKQQQYPLIIWLHGAGGIGTDNLQQISGDQVAGTRAWVKASVQAKHPAFVVVPQSSGGWGAQPVEEVSHDALSAPLVMVVSIVESLEREFNIDPHRIYVAGQSDGGYGTWDLITKQPGLFAAAIPICGGGDPEHAARLVKIPIWAFHGDADTAVRVSESRSMIAAITKAGGHPRYSEYKGAGHDIWPRVFAEPELIDWVFSQRN